MARLVCGPVKFTTRALQYCTLAHLDVIRNRQLEQGQIPTRELQPPSSVHTATTSRAVGHANHGALKRPAIEEHHSSIQIEVHRTPS
jgi:hypothetical protein